MECYNANCVSQMESEIKLLLKKWINHFIKYNNLI